MSHHGTALIVDDDASFRQLVVKLLEGSGIDTVEAASAEEALDHAAEADVVLLDVNLPDTSGYIVCRELRERYGDRLPIMFVSGYRTETIDRAAGMLLGGDDYVVKPPDADELTARVRRLVERSRLERLQTSTGYGLTPRELDVLRLLSAGRRASQIAEELGISPKTVSSHIERILSKLGVHSRAEAVARAYESGLVA